MQIVTMHQSKQNKENISKARLTWFNWRAFFVSRGNFLLLRM